MSTVTINRTPLPVRVDHEIQVSGHTIFPGYRWREAILYYLFGIWGDRLEVTYRPKISFGGVTLRLNVGARAYFAYGEHSGDCGGISAETEMLIVGCGQDEVEQGLIRFVKNDRIRVLVIGLPLRGIINLRKKERRGEYNVTAIGIPRNSDEAVPLLTATTLRAHDSHP